MKIKIIAVGSNMPHWVNEGIHTYQKRLPKSFSFDFIEIPLQKRPRSGSALTQIKKESTQMLAAIPANARVIALDLCGKRFSSEKLAEKFQSFQMDGSELCLLIGGPEGLTQEVKDKASLHWSLSDLTLPHPLVRVILAECLYRTFSILQQHPYHK